MPSADTDLRLLRLHGWLHAPDMPAVLARGQLIEHQLGLGPLRGALHLLLLTGHVLLIGDGLADPDLQAAIHEVRQMRRQVGTEEDRTLATARKVTETPTLGLLWSQTLQVRWARDGGGTEQEFRERSEGLAVHLAGRPVPRHVREVLVTYGDGPPERS